MQLICWSICVGSDNAEIVEIVEPIVNYNYRGIGSKYLASDFFLYT